MDIYKSINYLLIITSAEHMISMPFLALNNQYHSFHFTVVHYILNEGFL